MCIKPRSLGFVWKVPGVTECHMSSEVTGLGSFLGINALAELKKRACVLEEQGHSVGILSSWKHAAVTGAEGRSGLETGGVGRSGPRVHS